MAKLRPIGHEDRLSVVEHLDELRTRIIVSLLVFGVALGLCFWQNHLILRIVNHPLGHHHKPTTFGVAGQAAPSVPEASAPRSCNRART